MKTKNREFKRAPFFEKVLVLDNFNLFQGETLNISESGILLSNLSVDFNGQDLNFMFPLTTYPEFLFMDKEKLFILNKSDFSTEVFRCKGFLKRKKILDGKTSINYLEVGAEIDRNDNHLVKEIRKYVEIFEKNIEFVLMLFQDEAEQSKELIRILLSLLGYQNIEKFSLLRSQILHDYNSLLNC